MQLVEVKKLTSCFFLKIFDMDRNFTQIPKMKYKQAVAAGYFWQNETAFFKVFFLRKYTSP